MSDFCLVEFQAAVLRTGYLLDYDFSEDTFIFSSLDGKVVKADEDDDYTSEWTVLGTGDQVYNIPLICA